MDENKLIENIFNEFEKTNNQINELVRIQNELSNSENELIALQIRYVHKYILDLVFVFVMSSKNYRLFIGAKKTMILNFKSRRKTKY